MNVYDFDGTIFPSDCSIGFCIWCMNRHPKLWFTFAPKAIKNVILKKRGKLSEAAMQRKFFSYLTMIDNFYSDSLADTPLALCAEKAYLVTKKASTVVDWPDLDEETMSKVKKKIDTGWNVHLTEEEDK